MKDDECMAAAIVRKIDQLGRIVLPKELRNSLNINANDQFEFFVDGEMIIMRKRKFECESCDGIDDVFNYEGHTVCRKCIKR
ncbi:AbrB/MazE/SpoVT family DNA-binding domain-containing protein [Caproiciproducens sp.]|uniref:AbrB/MazE/SpoVT family DNA-binding domain-containing protein n=1 Tax=Caproiciproducens sp. TaxID=1954376 RepID=UPI0028976638|nr:AbrB/MazE/SpoVT family DNA-binding domain-containing protein [Caproiciproducens sp.]